MHPQMATMWYTVARTDRTHAIVCVCHCPFWTTVATNSSFKNRWIRIGPHLMHHCWWCIKHVHIGVWLRSEPHCRSTRHCKPRAASLSPSPLPPHLSLISPCCSIPPSPLAQHPPYRGAAETREPPQRVGLGHGSVVLPAALLYGRQTPLASPPGKVCGGTGRRDREAGPVTYCCSEWPRERCGAGDEHITGQIPNSASRAVTVRPVAWPRACPVAHAAHLTSTLKKLRSDVCCDVRSDSMSSPGPHADPGSAPPHTHPTCSTKANSAPCV